MKLGAEPKKLAVLGGLLLLGGYMLYTNVLSSPQAASPLRPETTAAARTAPLQQQPRPDAAAPSIRRAGNRISQGEASPTACIVDSQSVKSAEKGGPASIPMGSMQAS